MPFRRGPVTSGHLVQALAGNDYLGNDESKPRGGKGRAVIEELFIIEAGDGGGRGGREEGEGGATRAL
jgi:hypothetical protein